LEVDVDTAFTMVGSLALPKRLLALIHSGLWPRTDDEERHQSLNSVVSKERIHLFAPEEDQVYLFKPPFCTIAERVTSDKANFWSSFGALEQITPELCVDIGDFGLGSDSAIVLDYSEARSNPSVLRLKWRKPEPNAWVRCADTFDTFADMLGLDNNSRQQP